jgi:hypothetical protein
VNVALSANTRVHVSLFHNDTRYYMTKVESARRNDTTLYLKGSWDDDPQKSTAFAYETACLIRRRLKEESRIDTRIALTAGNTAELIDEGDLKW